MSKTSMIDQLDEGIEALLSAATAKHQLPIPRLPDCWRSPPSCAPFQGPTLKQHSRLICLRTRCRSPMRPALRTT